MILLVLVSLGVACEADGHGIGSETLPAKNLGDKQVLVEINAVTVADSDIDQQFTFQMSNMKTGEPIKDVTWHIKASKQNQLLFDETFESDSGTLRIDLINSGDHIVVEKESEVFGFIFGDKGAVRVSGPYFDYGGLYQFQISVITAESYSNKLNPPLTWNAGISLADITEYAVNDANFGMQEIRHISYYDIIKDLQYDQKSREISFSMPFDTSIDAINQTSIVHEEIIISKDFGDLMTSEMSATVNGMLMPEEVIQIDDFTENIRTIHLTMTQKNILEIYNQNKIAQSQLDFVIGPSAKDLPLSIVTKNGQFKIIMKTIEGKSGQELEILYKFVDVFLKDMPIGIDYDMYVVQNEKMLFRGNGVSNDKVGKWDSVKINIPKDVTGIIYVHFENLAGNSLAAAKLPIVIDRVQYHAETDIPDWVRSNAGWWSEGLISDEEFVGGIEFLIKQNIIIVSSVDAAGSSTIPDWVRSNAGWWSEGLISDEEFVGGIEFLISNGIIVV